MSIENFIDAMPKVELNARLEGAFRKESLMTIADENDISAEVKRFDDLVEAWDSPDFTKLAEHVRTYHSWLRFPDDLSRLVYDAGVALSKQNVKYVEMSVNLGLHMLSGMSFDEFIGAINYGRDRVERGWDMKMAWILTVMRDEPRLADETMRWAASASGQKQGIVAFGLSGSEASQPAGQFERAFHTATKKEIPVVAQAGDTPGAEGIRSVMELLPNRIVDGWGLLDDEDLVDQFSKTQMPLVVSLSRAVCLGWVNDYKDYPLRQLYDENIKLVLSAEMPNAFGTTLTEEYLAAVNDCGLTVEELQEISLNAIDAGYLDDEDKAKLREDFVQAYDALREEHLSSPEAT